MVAPAGVIPGGGEAGVPVQGQPGLPWLLPHGRAVFGRQSPLQDSRHQQVR